MNIQSNIINLNPLPNTIKPSGRSDTSGTDPAKNEAENKNQSSTQPLKFSDQTVDKEALFKSLESSENSQKVSPDVLPKDAASKKAIDAYLVNSNTSQQQEREEISQSLGFDDYS